MAEENPESEARKNDLPDIKSESCNDPLLTEIQHLKRVILDLQRKHQNSHTKPGRDISNQLELGEQELKRPSVCNQEESKLAFGRDFTKQINTSFRARVLGRRHKIGTDNQSQAAIQATDSKSEQKSIIYQINGDSALLGTERPDQQEEEPPRTQWTRPIISNHKEQTTEFHFRKKDYIPAIEAQNTKFHKYLNTYRQRNSVLKQKRQPASMGSSRQELWSTSSQPEFLRKDKRKPEQPSFASFLEINLTLSSSKEDIIEAGQTIFRHFTFSSQTNNFTIKKYKNCIVFSLMPAQTKAAIWYYSHELYFGNVSINEEGKVQRNGPGVEWVTKRHFYQGHFINNKKNGRGKIIYENGDQYDGQWHQGHIYGFGRYVDHNNKSYEGFWRNGQYQGQILQSNNKKLDFP